jgi:hypothetical protein
MEDLMEVLMIETVILLLGLVCPTPDLPTVSQVASVIQTEWPSPTVFGHYPYDLPTAPSEDGILSYRITVDPIYLPYGPCFSWQVHQILDDNRSWDEVREAEPGETPQMWIILAPPGASCPDLYIAGSCAAGGDGQGQVRINTLRWFAGYGESTLAESRIYTINHEVGHILGHGHIDCTVMGYPIWTADTVGEQWDVPIDSCGLIAWPSSSITDDQTPNGRSPVDVATTVSLTIRTDLNGETIDSGVNGGLIDVDRLMPGASRCIGLDEPVIHVIDSGGCPDADLASGRVAAENRGNGQHLR